MRVGLLTREFPPDVYGGAGVHVDFLSRHLRELVDLDVLCMGSERDGATAFAEKDSRFPIANPALHILSTDVAMAAACDSLDLVHSHTWYAN
ncbi:MAG: glycogen synthase, partial [Nocardioidaceae bacterium]